MTASTSNQMAGRYLKKFAISGLAIAFMVFLFIKAQPVDPIKHNELASDLRKLQMNDIELGETVLQHHYKILHNYDVVVALMKRMQALDAELAQYLQKGLLPDTPGVRRELSTVKQQVELKAHALEEFKSYNALIKNSLIYLPRTINDVLVALPTSDEHSHEQFELLLRYAMLLVVNQDDRSSKVLDEGIAMIEKVFPGLPVGAQKPAKLALKHAKIIKENEIDIQEVLAQLSSPSNKHIGAGLEQLYQEYYNGQQHSASQYRAILFLVAILMLGYGIYAYYRMKEEDQQLRIAAAAFETQEGIMITDANSNIIKVNQAFQKITGYSEADVLGKNAHILSSGQHDKHFYTAMWDSIHSTGTWQGEIWDRRKNGEIFPKWLSITATKDAQGKVTHYVGSHTDITERKAAEAEIERLAYYDHLTQLPNRRMLVQRLSAALDSSARNRQFGTLLFIDLDHFKMLNDTLGHDIGDLLLQQVAERLKSCLRIGDAVARLAEHDTVARLGGDEFVVMLEDLSEQTLEAASKTKIVGEKILANLNQPYRLSTHEYHSTASIGATLFIDNQLKTDELMKQADIAMYQAKKAGRNTLRFFDPKMQETVDTRAALENHLRNALEQQQFQLYYQIQVDDSNLPLEVAPTIWTAR